MSCCLYILAGADLVSHIYTEIHMPEVLPLIICNNLQLLTTARAIIVAQASKNPEILKCWAGSHDSPLVWTVFCKFAILISIWEHSESVPDM